ncbi:2OG-Fe(II) oxygenase family Oxidoreductase [Penicillium coprophilum]|uniref:2OG-Fe(II) oxygenase family Oxidoreductase n=1 Tax=Penicillium coprophilum TaxID=36646 RepID=UPI0023A17C5A|nr:2OG-Fe(II) oxygenase family Oxidoreductase [Penicillium coprophilum]KAJ5158341.1 2OG-Fe(II) oxygenase family Oxidoreductase [Penicillium coprophilum]
MLAAIGKRIVFYQDSATDLTKCADQRYSTEILSVDPLIIHIDNFVNEQEIDYLMQVGEPLFRASQLFDDTQVRSVDTPYRSSSTAFMPYDDPVCHCVGQRALKFLGFIEHVEYETLQLVRYYPGQEYNLHSDWLHRPKLSRSPRDEGREYNRLGSFFTYLGGNATGGETYFPFVNGASLNADGRKYAIPASGQGLVVKPTKGSALFWMNLHASNGTGDERTLHAGLPVHSGVKYGMNVWTKHYKSSPIIGPYESREDQPDDLNQDFLLERGVLSNLANSLKHDSE